MEHYRCVRCDVVVAKKDRDEHAATAEHQANGGRATVVDEDWEPEAGGEGTRGTSWTR